MKEDRLPEYLKQMKVLTDQSAIGAVIEEEDQIHTFGKFAIKLCYDCHCTRNKD